MIPKIDIVKFIPEFISRRERDSATLLDIDYKSASSPYRDFQSVQKEILGTYMKHATIESDPGGGINTYDFLKAYYTRIQNDDPEVAKYGYIIGILQKKYEIYRRIFSSYNKEFRRDSNSSSDIEIYSLLAIIMQTKYLKYNDYNDLNTALKLNDLVLRGELHIRPEYKRMIFLSVVQELMIIRQINEL